MTFPTSPLQDSYNVGVEGMDRINEHFADASQHTRTTIPGFSPSSTGAQNRAAFAAELTDSSESYYVPPGIYDWDPTDSIGIANFSGRLTFARTAQIRFTNNAYLGYVLAFSGGYGAIIDGWNSVFATEPTSRSTTSGAEVLMFFQTTDTLCTNYRINSSRAVGTTCYECVRPTYYNGWVMNTMADGLAMHSCQDGAIIRHITRDSGDDAITVQNIETHVNGRGAFISNVAVYNSTKVNGSRPTHNHGARGISIVGQSDVFLDNFFINTTRNAGLLVIRDTSFLSRVPENVYCSNGVIVNAGVGHDDVEPATSFHGVDANGFKDCTLENVEVIDPHNRGFNIWTDQPDARFRGINLTARGANSESFHIDSTPNVDMRGVTRAEESDGYGFTIKNCTNVDFDTLFTKNVSKANPADRALHLEDNDNLIFHRLVIRDSQSPPTGSQIFMTGTNNGYFSDVVYMMEAGNFYSSQQAGVRIGTVNGVAPNPQRQNPNSTLNLTADDAPVQRFDSATNNGDNVTVNLPFNGHHDGQSFRFVRTNGGTGTVDIGSLKTIPTTVNAFVDVTWDHPNFVWRLTGYGVL